MRRNCSHLIALGAILFSLPSHHAYSNEPAFAGEQAKAEAFAPNGIDAYVQRRMQRDHIPGVSVAILREGKVIHCKGYGMANVELSAAATENSVYQIASLTKPFTATAIMLLAEDGKLSIDEQVRKYIPDLPTSWEDVTVRQLLSHTSGIKNGTKQGGFAETVRKDFTPRELIDTVTKEPLDFKPGENWNYSNTGYIVLGMLIEKLSGKSYGVFMDERIFKPLGMANTRANDLHAVIAGRVQGYTWDMKFLRIGEYHSPTQPFAAGMLVSTVADLAKWDRSLDAGTLLKRPILEQMWAPVRTGNGDRAGYGLGWEIKEINGHRSVGHGGGIPGFSTCFTRYGDDHLTVIVLTNSNFGNVETFASGIAAQIIPALGSGVERPIEDTDAATTERLKAMIRKLATGDVEPALFTEKSKENWIPQLKSLKDWFASMGALKSFQPHERKDGDQHVMLRYRAVFDNEALDFFFTLNKAGKIEDMNVRRLE
jgi:D-alanyl-D-alanine carboxypeptidase